MNRHNWGIVGLASKASFHSYIPSLSISNQDNSSTGRVLDPTTYQFLTNRTVFDMSATVGTSMTLFSGFDRSQKYKAATSGDLLNIQADITNANTAYEKYELLKADVDKCTEALRHTKEKYDVGAITYYDYRTAVGNLF